MLPLPDCVAEAPEPQLRNHLTRSKRREFACQPPGRCPPRRPPSRREKQAVELPLRVPLDYSSPQPCFLQMRRGLSDRTLRRRGWPLLLRVERKGRKPSII